MACGAPQVSYRETVRGACQVTYHHKQVAGQQRENAIVGLKVYPAQGCGPSYQSELGADNLPPSFAEAGASAVTQVFSDGLLIGFPMTDLSVTLRQAEWNADSTPAAFKIATRRAMREACEAAGIVLLEPIMAVNVECPVNATGAVVGDIDARRGQIYDQDLNGDISYVNALVPLAQMFGYQNELQKLTAGAGRFGMTYSHYAEVPRNRSGGPDEFPPAVGMRA